MRAGWSAAAVLAMACGSRPGVMPEPARPVSTWSYEVVPSEGASELAVTASFPVGAATRFEIDDGGRAFVRGVEVWRGGAFARVDEDEGGRTWTLPECAAGACRVRYRFALREAGEQLGDPDAATVYGDVLVAPPATWVLRPATAPIGTKLALKLACVAPTRCAAGLPRARGRAETYEIAAAELDAAGYAVFGAFDVEEIAAGASKLDLVVASKGLGLGREQLAAWTRTSAAAIGGYFGKVPDHVLVFAVPGARPGIEGETLGASVRMVIDANMTTPGSSSWVLPHELVHVCSPTLGRQHAWLEEGLATYVEPLARVRAGEVTAEKAWMDMVEGMPQGQPQAGDEGLERTHTWGRTYWGGAMFCLMADVAIRERTANKRCLEDAMRAMVALGANAAAHWTIERFIDVGDSATGVPVLRELYDKLALAPVTVDLAALYARLGVDASGSAVSFRDDAPLAGVRRAITAAR